MHMHVRVCVCLPQVDGLLATAFYLVEFITQNNLLNCHLLCVVRCEGFSVLVVQTTLLTHLLNQYTAQNSTGTQTTSSPSFVGQVVCQARLAQRL